MGLRDELGRFLPGPPHNPEGRRSEMRRKQYTALLELFDEAYPEFAEALRQTLVIKETNGHTIKRRLDVAFEQIGRWMLDGGERWKCELGWKVFMWAAENVRPKTMQHRVHVSQMEHMIGDGSTDFDQRVLEAASGGPIYPEHALKALEETLAEWDGRDETAENGAAKGAAGAKQGRPDGADGPDTR